MAYAIFKVNMYNKPHLLKKKTSTLFSIKTALLHHLYIEIKKSFFFWQKNKQSFIHFVTYTFTLYVVLRELSGDRMLHNVIIIYM